MAIKSVLTPEGSIVAGFATVGLVYGIYQMDIGPVTSVHLSEPYDGAATSAIKKAGWTSLIAVAGLSLLARDPNIAILGGAAIVAFHAHYRHANMVHPQTGRIVPPGPDSFQPAQYSVSAALQGPNS